jgi:peroxiredoxin Q/BCP
MSLELGKQAPDFSIPATNGKTVSLSDFKGKNIVLYFYPKDMTSGCTTEACDFKERGQDFSNLNTVILGISPDSVASHQKFIQKYELPFLLLADEHQQVCSLYEVWKKKSMYGKEYMGVERSTFLIDKHGKLVNEWRKVSVKGHVDEALAYVKEHLQL